jgi:polysaccharide biosynthesis/export protein
MMGRNRAVAGKRIVVLIALPLLFAAVMMAQAQAPNQPTPAPNSPAPISGEAPKTGPLSPNDFGLGVDQRTFVIGPMDVLAIRVFREENFTQSVQVRSDGMITLPLINDVQAAGLTPDRLRVQLTEALSGFLQKPEVTVQVLQVNSRRYTVTGGVFRPGPYPLITATRVFDAINAAGGFQEFAKKSDVVVIRVGKNEHLHFNYSDYVKGKKGKNSDNFLLENGDTIIVQQ